MRKVTREWVAKAEGDWLAAGNLARSGPAGRRPFHDQVCFHCQQSAEKYLKALLQEGGARVPYIHDLEAILALLEPGDPPLKSLRRAATVLTPYAVEYRYPGVKATKRHATAALRHAEKVRAAARDRLGLPV